MEGLLKLNKAVVRLDRAIKELAKKHPSLELTGEVNVYEEEEIIGKEIIITSKTSFEFKIQLAGWVELDRRIEENGELYIWFNGILIIPEFDIKIGGGFNNNYTIIRADFEYGIGWSEFYKNIL